MALDALDEDVNAGLVTPDEAKALRDAQSWPREFDLSIDELYPAYSVTRIRPTAREGASVRITLTKAEWRLCIRHEKIQQAFEDLCRRKLEELNRNRSKR